MNNNLKFKDKKYNYKSVLFILILCCMSFIFIFNCSIKNNKFTYAESQTSAKAMVVMETKSKRVLFNKNINQKLPMASTTKIITALTVLENCKNLDEEIKIHPGAVGIPGTSIYLKNGETMTIKELLYGMMLPSGNDAATALAYYIGGDIPKFCELMQTTALSVGAENSCFQNPHGLDAVNHYTTAYDLALITSRALQNDVFKEIVSTKAYRIKGCTQGAYRYLKNKNKLLNTLDGCTGVKTGFTNGAGRCLVSSANRNGMELVCVCLNCGPMFEESAVAINNAYDNYSLCTLLPPYKIIRSLKVDGGNSETVKLFTKKEFKYPITNSEASMLEFRYDLPNLIYAPVKKDDVVGKIEIYLNNHLLFSEKIYTMDNVKKIGVWSSIKDIVSNW